MSGLARLASVLRLPDRWALTAALLLCMAGPLAASDGADAAAPQTVDNVDLSRYVGLWYEVLKIPNRFQDQCARNTSAEYRLRDDGRIDVINRCRTASGEADTAQGLARVVDAASNAKLEVSFIEFWGWRPFWGDYWVLGLAEDYSWAVIGTPNRKYGWVLSRTPVLDGQAAAEVRAILRANGYDPGDFATSPQDGEG